MLALALTLAPTLTLSLALALTLIIALFQGRDHFRDLFQTIGKILHTPAKRAKAAETDAERRAHSLTEQVAFGRRLGGG